VSQEEHQQLHQFADEIGFSFSDTVGAAGVLVRWLQGPNWSAELGWVRSFQTNDNPGPWTDWLLGKGLYAKLQYRF